MSPHWLREDELRIIIRQRGFRVKTLAVHVGLDVRTLERRFSEQLQITPRAWIRRERMSFAPPLLVEGFSNKQVAASLGYTCESNFCRDFKRHFGCAPQMFARINECVPAMSRIDKYLSRLDNDAQLPGQSSSRTLRPWSMATDSRRAGNLKESRAVGPEAKEISRNG